MPYYGFADLIWQIHPQNRYLQNLLCPYMVEENDTAIPVPPQAGDWEQETNGVLRAVHEALVARFDGLLFHAAVLVYKEKAYLFTAPPGTGKTTHVLLWKACLGDDVWILNGDKPFLRLHGETVVVHGGPWRGKECLGTLASCQVGGIYLLRRGQKNEVVAASTQEKLSALLLATILPANAAGKQKLLMLLDAVCRRVPISALNCNMETEAVEVVRRHIDQENRL